jgi:hypothetical protein
MKELKQGALKGEIQIYPHCFNLNVVGTGTATPEGVAFPGAYKPDDAAFRFDPYMTYGTPIAAAGIAHNGKFVSFFSFFPLLPPPSHSLPAANGMGITEKKLICVCPVPQLDPARPTQVCRQVRGGGWAGPGAQGNGTVRSCSGDDVQGLDQED